MLSSPKVLHTPIINGNTNDAVNDPAAAPPLSKAIPSNNAGVNTDSYCKTAITKDDWIHLAVTINGSTVTFYQNGVSIGTGTKEFTSSKNINFSTGLVVGGDLRDKNDHSSIIPCIDLKMAEELFKSEVISGGMIPKVECCIDAIHKGVKKVTILDGRVPHALLIETLTDEGAGTMVVADMNEDDEL